MRVRKKCRKHGISLICFCPACRGSITTPAKRRAARENGKLGGRPPKGIKQ